MKAGIKIDTYAIIDPNQKKFIKFNYFNSISDQTARVTLRSDETYMGVDLTKKRLILSNSSMYLKNA